MGDHFPDLNIHFIVLFFIQWGVFLDLGSDVSFNHWVYTDGMYVSSEVHRVQEPRKSVCSMTMIGTNGPIIFVFIVKLYMGLILWALCQCAEFRFLDMSS